MEATQQQERPRTLTVRGPELFAMAERQRKGEFIISRMERGPGNADWLLTLLYPDETQIAEVNHESLPFLL